MPALQWACQLASAISVNSDGFNSSAGDKLAPFTKTHPTTMASLDNSTTNNNQADPSPTPSNPLLRPSNPAVSPLEQEVLDEYTRLLGNVNKASPRQREKMTSSMLIKNGIQQLSTTLSTLSASPSSLTLDGLRLLERKTATVCTLLKASVYSIVLQQQIWNESEEDHQVQVQQEQGLGYGQEHGMPDEEGFEGEGDVSFG